MNPLLNPVLAHSTRDPLIAYNIDPVTYPDESVDMVPREMQEIMRQLGVLLIRIQKHLDFWQRTCAHTTIERMQDVKRVTIMLMDAMTKPTPTQMMYVTMSAVLNTTLDELAKAPRAPYRRKRRTGDSWIREDAPALRYTIKHTLFRAIDAINKYCGDCRAKELSAFTPSGITLHI